MHSLRRDLCHEFDSIVSAMMCLLENSLFPDEDINEQDMQQNLLEKNMNETLNKNLSPHVKINLNEFFLNQKEIKMIIPENNWKNSCLLDLQKRL